MKVSLTEISLPFGFSEFGEAKELPFGSQFVLSRVRLSIHILHAFAVMILLNILKAYSSLTLPV